MSPSEPDWQLLEELRSKGVRITSQRRVVIEIMQAATQHLDADTLLQHARELYEGIDRATIYRTLELLKKHRLIDELDLMHLNGEKHYYEARRDSDHMHLACFSCGRIQEFSSPLYDQLKKQIAIENKFEIRVVRLEVGGRCSACTRVARSKGKSERLK